jgi:formiminoglutamase
MSDISLFFQPVDIQLRTEESLGQKFDYHDQNGFPVLQRKGIAVFYVPEYRNGKPEFHNKQDATFRSILANYFTGFNWTIPLYDLGDLKPGATVQDTYYVVQKVVEELIKLEIIPVIIGGTQDLTFPIYLGYQRTEQMINVLAVDHSFDLGAPEEELFADKFVNKLLMHRPCYLFNYSVVGIQSPLVRSSEMNLFENLHFDTIRLGEYIADSQITEPYLRNADFISIDLTSIRSSEWSSTDYTQPNGFLNSDVCQIARYAGLSDKLTSFALLNLFPGNLSESDHAIVAQSIWYFIDGVSNRFGDFPLGSRKEYARFTVLMDEHTDQLVFYKSPKSERWWLEVPHPKSKTDKYIRHTLIPCSKKEYESAMTGQIPLLWWKTYKKLL